MTIYNGGILDTHPYWIGEERNGRTTMSNEKAMRGALRPDGRSAE